MYYTEGPEFVPDTDEDSGTVCTAVAETADSHSVSAAPDAQDAVETAAYRSDAQALVTQGYASGSLKELVLNAAATGVPSAAGVTRQQGLQETDWIVDSGATGHCTGNPYLLSGYRKPPERATVRFGAGPRMPVAGVGDAQLQTPNGPVQVTDACL